VIVAQGTFDEIDVFAKTDIDPGNRTDYWKAMINTKGASHLYVVQNTVAPGGSLGWHRNPGPSLVMVLAGAATEYHGDDPTCTPYVHQAGSTFVDAGEASGHLVRNEGSVNLVVVVVRLIPEGPRSGSTPSRSLPGSELMKLTGNSIGAGQVGDPGPASMAPCC
jgi:hypothetical protein